MRWVIAFLVVLALWMAFVLRVIYISPDSKLLGGFFLVIGLLNVLFYRSTGRKFFARTQLARPFVAKFWARVDERGVLLLFLGIGVIFSVAGVFLIVAGSVFARVI